MKVQGRNRAVVNCTIPKCAEWNLRKAYIWTGKSIKVAGLPYKEMELKKYDLNSDQRVQDNNYESKVPRRMYQSRGRTDTKDIYSRGCIFVDHASGYIYLVHQVELKTVGKSGENSHFRARTRNMVCW